MEELTNNLALPMDLHQISIHCLLPQEQEPQATTQDSGRQEIHHINKLYSTSINLSTAAI
eukprot:5531936-Ditylum_brightwellii.AAC.2